jgi:putative flippase GtrA
MVSLEISALYWAMLYSLTEYCKLWYMYSALIATVSLSLFGFLMSSTWVWKGNKGQEVSIVRAILKQWKNPIRVIELAWHSQFVRYYIVGIGGSMLGLLQQYIYTAIFHNWYMASAILGSAGVIVTTFIARDRWIWGKEK